MTGIRRALKAALRGLDLALEEGLNVKLVLIPDKEDPDSYLQKKGAAAFTDFIHANKKDFILFQLDIALADAGDDSYKKSTIVNQIAETIAKVNKAEDFTRQQDYIRRSSEILKIDEGGLHTLVNKYIRERVSKDERKNAPPGENNQLPASEPGEDGEVYDLLNKDEQSERAMVRSLMEFGFKGMGKRANRSRSHFI